MANANKQAGQLPAGPSPESFAPHCGHDVSADMCKIEEQWRPEAEEWRF
jgi:hypothetical protein